MLGSSDPPLPFPWSSQLEGELRELRCHYGSELYRVVYRRSRNLFVLLHMFRKDTGRVPEAELRIARERCEGPWQCWRRHESTTTQAKTWYGRGLVKGPGGGARCCGGFRSMGVVGGAAVLVGWSRRVVSLVFGGWLPQDHRFVAGWVYHSRGKWCTFRCLNVAQY